MLRKYDNTITKQIDLGKRVLMDSVNQMYLSRKKMKKLSEDELKTIWNEYWADKDNKKIKDTLVVQYFHLIRYVVGRMRVTLPETISSEDITGFGVEGLIKAIEKFEIRKHARFETYAIMRIRGEIIDGIRAEDWIPRSIRKLQKEINATTQLMQKEQGRVPDDKEIAAKLNISVSKLKEVRNYTSSSNIMSLNVSKEESIEIIETIEDEKHINPLDILENNDSRKDLIKGLSRLPEKERLILTLYYHENLTFGEIGTIIKISESRCCQIHAQAIMKLRNILSANKMGLRKIVED